ncbi:single-stranded DNA-binding protein [Acerihabitans sp. TG2]|uniref:single-stranded DNA-binding protein n=1 Tax=Acerihabitans sp. TG2 TaxID=3096008 RepID=UPI002B23B84D|nr:single-stranded DNA-binding protein [Acerihabitans sp. TG2]MEA9392210.1 single-stranded DNA-binding protein [Acerihabitans sp. TG2]
MLRNALRMTGFVGKDRNIRSNENTGEITGLSFSLAVNSRVPDPEKPGDWIDGTDWFPVQISARNRSFEFLKKHLLKGAQVQIGGYLRRVSWESKSRRDEGGAALTDFRNDVIATEVLIIRYAKSDASQNATDNDVPPQDYSDQTPPGDSADYDNLMPEPQ